MIVVDTHIIVWDALAPEKLSKKAKAAIAEADREDGILFCEISLWEIAMMLKKRRITLESTYAEFIKLVLASKNYILRGMTPEIAELSTQLPEDFNKDPADRIIAATSILSRVSLVTADRNLNSVDSLLTIW